MSHLLASSPPPAPTEGTGGVGGVEKGSAVNCAHDRTARSARSAAPIVQAIATTNVSFERAKTHHSVPCSLSHPWSRALASLKLKCGCPPGAAGGASPILNSCKSDDGGLTCTNAIRIAPHAGTCASMSHVCLPASSPQPPPSASPLPLPSSLTHSLSQAASSQWH